MTQMPFVSNVGEMGSAPDLSIRCLEHDRSIGLCRMAQWYEKSFAHCTACDLFHGIVGPPFVN